MNGCQYAQKKFSAPASWHTDQLTWDIAFMSDSEFQEKYHRTITQITKRLETDYVDVNGRWQTRK